MNLDVFIEGAERKHKQGQVEKEYWEPENTVVLRDVNDSTLVDPREGLGNN